MVEKYYVMNEECGSIRNTYEEAVKEAKIDASNGRQDQYIFKAIAVARAPVPEVTVETL